MSNQAIDDTAPPRSGGNALTSHEALSFPPLGNSMLMKVGRAEVTEAPEFAGLLDHVGTLDLGPTDLPDHLTDWLTTTVKVANDASFRFDLRHVHGADEPTLIDLATSGGIDWVRAPRLSAARGTCKLVLVLGLEGDGTATVDANGADSSSVLTAGVLIIAPAYLRLNVRFAGGSLRCLATTVHGPAFR